MPAEAELAANVVAEGRGTIAVEEVVDRFEGGVPAVDHVRFEAIPGEPVSMVGPRGCGSPRAGRDP